MLISLVYYLTYGNIQQRVSNGNQKMLVIEREREIYKNYQNESHDRSEDAVLDAPPVIKA